MILLWGVQPRKRIGGPVMESEPHGFGDLVTVDAVDAVETVTGRRLNH